MEIHERDEQAIREIEAEARNSARARDVDRYVSVYADDAVLFWPGTPMITGKTAIREFMKIFFANPACSLSFQTVKVETSQYGDLAYSYGTNTVTLTDPEGHQVEDRGKYLTIYKKQPDGTWKVVADAGNSDLPAPISKNEK